MKLPEIHYSQVESLGRHDTGGITALASAERQKGAVSQQAMQQLAGVAADYIARQENMEYDTQLADASIELSQWEMENKAKAFYTSEEIEGLPDHIKRTITGTDGLGNPVSEPRTSIPAYEVYPLLLEQKLQGMIKEKAENITNPHLRREFINTSETVAAERVMRASIAAEEAQRSYVIADGKERAADAAENGNFLAAASIIAKLEISDLEKKQLIDAAEFKDAVFYVNEAIRSTDQETVMVMRSTLEDPNYDGPLNEAQRQGAVTALNKQFEQLDFERDRDLKVSKAINFNDYRVGVKEGKYTRLDLDAAYDLWKDDQDNPDGIDPVQHAQLVEALRSFHKGIADTVDYDTLLAGFFDGTAPANPNNKDHRDAIGYLVETQGLTRENVDELGYITQKTGIMPQPLIDLIDGQILNGDVQQGIVAMGLYQQLNNGAPHLTNQLGATTKEAAELADLYMRGGANPAEALSQARQYQRDVTPDQRKFYAEQYTAEVRDENIDAVGNLESLMSNDSRWEMPWYRSNVESHPDMVAQFTALTKQHYPVTKGNIKQAQALAYEGIRKTWGITEAGGNGKKRAMKNPPEQLLQMTPDQLNKGLAIYAAENNLAGKELYLASDSDTPKNHSWQVLTLDKETNLFELHGVRFNGPDISRKVIANQNAETKQQIQEEHTKVLEAEQRRERARGPAGAGRAGSTR